MRNISKKIIIAFGTRPEAIKMCPLILELKRRKNISVTVVFTAQHRELADDVLTFFGVKPDYDMNIMRHSQSLFDITGNIMRGIREIFLREKPDAVIVHGDTTTAFTAALSAFYMKIPVFHVEAGLRSHMIDLPFPEEFNRRAISVISAVNFAPTNDAAENLINEGVPYTSVYVTGNTVIDALKYTVKENYKSVYLNQRNGEKIIFLTAHRRESIGKTLEEMLLAVKKTTELYSGVYVLYPIHPNPQVRAIAERILGKCERICLCEPLNVEECHNVIARCHMVLTDSGGLQEEAAALGKPVLIMRDVTERPEGIKAGAARLAGTDRYQIMATVGELLDNRNLYETMSEARCPYGDGNACVKISDIIEQRIENGMLRKSF